MAAGDAYLWGSTPAPSVLKVGTTGDDLWTLNCVLPITVESAQDRATRTRVGCRLDPQYLEGSRPEGTDTITFEILDGLGLEVAAKTMRRGAANTTNIPISIMPEGAGAGLPVQTYTGMTLVNKSMAGDGSVDADDAAVRMTLTFERGSDEEPAWAAQSA